MINGAIFSGNLFFDPLAGNLATAAGTASGTPQGTAQGTGPGTAAEGPDGAPPVPPQRQRGVQTAAEHRALRAASLSKVSRDLERMLRERRR
ncbi:hypothetical protein [Pseudarthrobacter sp. C4D7]|uniref:hypothetical protein n=1 Tax=Pseudarthrobacter sp. C4D7 TaxID=2735268 RepID=UPI0015848720|nr:hypothetical protein [Pseudarthrobacter sp. C4D7]NUT71442.1 hypothetical protein [Pseudarthrobacter sp. C4D7]